MKPVGFVTILLIGWFVYSVSSSFAVQAPLSLEQTSTTRFENVPPNFTYRVPTGAVARAKLFSFVLQSLTVEARLGDQIQTFQLTDIPAFARPKADSYQNQETISPQFQIALQMQATEGASYRLVSATYVARFALDLSFGGELDTVVQPPDEMTLQGTVNLDTPPFEALGPDVFLCIGLEIQQMAVDVSMQQEVTKKANFSFAQSPIVSSEFIVNDVRALSFTTTSDLPLQTQVVFRVDGMIHFALEYVCLTRSDYPLTEKDIRLGQPAQPAPARRNFNRNARLNPEFFQVLSAWPVDVQWFNQDGPLPGANTPAITTDRFNNQDRVYAQVTFKGGPKIGETVKTPSTFIPNHAPSIRSVEIIADPSPPITTSTLRILPQEWTDEDGDAENYRYYWFNQNGLIPGAESDILDGSYFQRGDTLFGRIIPFDGIYEGAGVQTESIIRDAPPRFDALRMGIDTTMARTNSVLTARPIGWQDADGDPEGYQYIWYNQNGPLGVDFPNEETIKVQRVFPLNATAPFQLQRGNTLNVSLIGIQEGTVRFISPGGRVIEHRIPEAQGSEIRGSLPVTLDEIGDYTIKETFHLIVRSTNPLIPVESRGEQQFTWTYANPAPAKRLYHYTTQLRHLIVDVSGQLQAHVEVPAPAMEIQVRLVVQETIPAGRKIAADVRYQADFIKRSAIAATNVLITGQSLSGAYFDAGDKVYVVVTATDGLDFGNTLKSEPILILNTPPSLSRLQMTADTSPPTPDSKLVATVEGVYDDDRDEVTILYQWYNQNGPIQGATGTTLTGPFLPGDTLYVEATPFDGKEKGKTLQSDGSRISGSEMPGYARFIYSLVRDMRKVQAKSYIPDPKSRLPGIPISEVCGKPPNIYAQAMIQVIFPNQVQFIDQSMDHPTYWLWVLEKDQNSGAQNPHHEYEREQQLIYKGARYPVTLTASGKLPTSYWSDSAMKPVSIPGDIVLVKLDKGWEPLDNRCLPPNPPIVPGQILGPSDFINISGQTLVKSYDAGLILKAIMIVRVEASNEKAKELVQIFEWDDKTVRSILREVVEAPFDLSDNVDLSDTEEEQNDFGSKLNVSMPDVSAQLGDTGVVVPVKVKNWEFMEEVLSAEIVLTFEPTVLCVTNISVSESQWENPVFDYRVTDGVIKIAIASTGLKRDGASELAYVTFNVLSTASTEQKRPLKLSAVSLNDAQIQAIRSGGFTITPPPHPPWDVDRDKKVDIFDLVLVGQHFGEKVEYPRPNPSAPNPDVDRNCTVDIFDLVLVGLHFGERYDNEPTLASPPLAPGDMQPGDIAVLQAMYDHLAAIPNPGPDVIYVKSLLVRLIESVPVLEPKLLPNFPNPFNPETWIPYQLAKPAAVTIKIYTQSGQFVRTLSLGQKDAGRYLLKDKAAYWDGRNDFGERAASGVYFYSLTANDFTATRKMLILK